MKSKKAAMELSVSTIVVIVLAMSMLIFGLILIRNIFAGGTNAIDSINDQVSSEINKMFGEDKKVVIYPTVSVIDVRIGEVEGFALGIKNKLTGNSAKNAEFSYEVVPVSDVEGDCDITKEELLDIATGDPKALEILLEPKEGDPLCTVRFRVDVKANGDNYDYAYVYVRFID